jgi:hypothetical protein
MSYKFTGDGTLHGKEHSISFPLFYFIMHIIRVVIYHYSPHSKYPFTVVGLYQLKADFGSMQCWKKVNESQPFVNHKIRGWRAKTLINNELILIMNHEPLTVLSFLHDYHLFHFDAV